MDIRRQEIIKRARRLSGRACQPVNLVVRETRKGLQALFLDGKGRVILETIPTKNRRELAKNIFHIQEELTR